MRFVRGGGEKYIWFPHPGREQFFELAKDPGECVDLSRRPEAQPRIQVWRERLAQVNEERGDPRGKGGQLVPQRGGALALSHNYRRWKERAEELEKG